MKVTEDEVLKVNVFRSKIKTFNPINEKMADQTSTLAVVLGIIIILLIIIVIAVVLARPWIKNDVALNQPCSDSKLCVAGLTCESGICKANPGSSCTTDSDCSANSTGCFNGVCASGIIPLNPPPGFIPIRGLTEVFDPTSSLPNRNTRSCDTVICPSGQTCQGSIVLLNGQRVYQFGRNKVLDVTEIPMREFRTEKREVLILLDSGAIMRDIDGVITQVSNNVKLDRILMIGDVLAGTSNGILYWLPPDNFRHSRWTWRVADWAPRHIVHIVTTLNNESLWIQNADPREPGSLGELYRINPTTNPTLEQTEALDGRTFRYYGFTLNSFVNIDPIRKSAFSDMQGLTQTIPDMVDGGFTSIDQVLRISSEVNNSVWSFRVFNQLAVDESVATILIRPDNIYEIQNRLCS